MAKLTVVERKAIMAPEEIIIYSQPYDYCRHVVIINAIEVPTQPTNFYNENSLLSKANCSLLKSK